MRGFMSSGTKITVWEEIVAVPVGILVLVIGVPVVAGIELWKSVRADVGNIRG